MSSHQFVAGQDHCTFNSNIIIFNLNFRTGKWSILFLNSFIIELLTLQSEFRCIVVILYLLYCRSFKWVFFWFSDIELGDHILSSFIIVGFVALWCSQTLSFLNVNGFVMGSSSLTLVWLRHYCSLALVIFFVERFILVYFSDVLLGFCMTTFTWFEFYFPVSIVRSLRLCGYSSSSLLTLWSSPLPKEFLDLCTIANLALRNAWMITSICLFGRLYILIVLKILFEMMIQISRYCCSCNTLMVASSLNGSYFNVAFFISANSTKLINLLSVIAFVTTSITHCIIFKCSIVSISLGNVVINLILEWPLIRHRSAIIVCITTWWWVISCRTSCTWIRCENLLLHDRRCFLRKAIRSTESVIWNCENPFLLISIQTVLFSINFFIAIAHCCNLLFKFNW